MDTMMLCNFAKTGKCLINEWTCMHKKPHEETSICKTVVPDDCECKGHCVEHQVLRIVKTKINNGLLGILFE